MRERHNSTDKWVQRSAGSAAALLFCLAGAAVGVAQNAPADAPPAIRNPMSPPGATGAAANEKVRVDEHMIVDLHVNDEDLGSILQMLSLQSQRSIVASRNVSAMVTANLYGVTFYEALDAILHINGYGYIERGNFIYVYTLDELQKIEAAQRTRAWRVLRLDYLNAVDAAEFVRPLLSELGQIKTNGRPGAFADTGAVSGEDFSNESTMLIFDFEENLEEIERVLVELDSRPAQVLIEATILQTALTEANAFGVDFSVIGDMNFTDFMSLGGPMKAVDAMIGGTRPDDNRGRAVVSTAGNTPGPATFKGGIVHNDVAAFLRLLDEVSDTSILSRPNLLILNRTTGRVLVGRKVGYLSTTSTDTATTQSVEFLDTGTQLIVRPFIAADGMIRMDLKPKVSEALIRNTTTAGGQAVTIPDEISNELTTSVLVRDGHTIVLGGLFRESTQATRRQIPFAGDLPIIGAAFRGHEDDVTRSEVIFMITPTVMADNVLLAQGQRAEAAVEHVRTGSRQGLLFFSREKRTQQMLVQARELAAKGDRRRAIYKVNRALRLNPNQPDALAMREQLSQTQRIWPTRSIQHEIISGEIERIDASRPSPAPPPLSPASPVAEASAESTAPIDDDEPLLDGAGVDDEPVDFLTPVDSPKRPTEQANAPEEQLSSAVPPKAPDGQAPSSAPGAGAAKSVTASGTTPGQAAAVATPVAAGEPPPKSAPAVAARPESKVMPAATDMPAPPPAQAAGGAQQEKPAPSSPVASTPTSASGTVQANPQQAIESGPRESVAAKLARLQPKKAPSAEEPELKANVAAGGPVQPSPVWSSALSAALAESGDLEFVMEPGESDEPQWIVPDGVEPEDWEYRRTLPAGEGPSSGVLAVLGSFQTVWDMFSAYAAQAPGPTVTSAPTDMHGDR